MILVFIYIAKKCQHLVAGTRTPDAWYLQANLLLSPSPVFDKDELRQALTPVLDKLVKQDPESLPFRTPVDPVLLHIPVSFFIYTYL